MGHEDEDIEQEEGEGERREAAIASTPCLQPSFKPRHVTQNQLSKLQELHKRRLQIKSKIHKKSKDGAGKSQSKYRKDSSDKDAGTNIEDSDVLALKSHNDNTNFSVHQDNLEGQHVPKKHQKLHWGLDTKERWERKANM